MFEDYSYHVKIVHVTKHNLVGLAKEIARLDPKVTTAVHYYSVPGGELRTRLSIRSAIKGDSKYWLNVYPEDILQYEPAKDSPSEFPYSLIDDHELERNYKRLYSAQD